MSHPDTMPPTVLVIFGAGGDLTWRKLAPGLFDLARKGFLPDPFEIIGVGRSALGDEKLRARFKRGVDQFSHGGNSRSDAWRTFVPKIHFLRGDLLQDRTYGILKKRLRAIERSWKSSIHVVFYLATPPMLFTEIPRRLSRAGMLKDRERTRLVIEKPFGHDAESAGKLNAELSKHADERQLFRIDHYLGKETVQNVLAVRFANPLFEPLWNRNYVDHVAITVAEDLGVEHRGPYYEKAGALRDMVQNHLMQLFCLVGMETMASFDADEIRNRKVDLLRAVRPISAEAVHQHVVSGQYGAGYIGSKKVRGYREEKDVDPESRTETFAALKLWVDNWRWTGVPFYFRTGKRMTRSASEIAIHFRAVPHQVFPNEARLDWQPARLIMVVEPDEGIILRFQSKEPGPRFHLRGAAMKFNYRQAFGKDTPSAYETLLLDILQNDPTLFMRFDQVELAWQILQPILDARSARPSVEFPNYPAGSWGPPTSAALLARDGRNWLPPARLGKGTK